MSRHANEPKRHELAKSAPDSAGACGSRTPVAYEPALEMQAELVRLRQEGEIPDLLWLLEHPATITFGTSGGPEHLLSTRERLEELGIAVRPTRRGGDATCHEPGQLVGYPIVDLGQSEADRDIHLFLRRIEEGLIGTLDDYGIESGRVEGRTGVWLEADRSRGLGERKIIAMGIQCRRWVTSHGFAFNVENDLAGFGHIVPCGIHDAGVTSLARELESLGRARPDWDDVSERVHRSLERALERPLRRVVGGEARKLVESEG